MSVCHDYDSRPLPMDQSLVTRTKRWCASANRRKPRWNGSAARRVGQDTFYNSVRFANEVFAVGDNVALPNPAKSATFPVRWQRCCGTMMVFLNVARSSSLLLPLKQCGRTAMVPSGWNVDGALQACRFFHRSASLHVCRWYFPEEVSGGRKPDHGAKYGAGRWSFAAVSPC